MSAVADIPRIGDPVYPLTGPEEDPRFTLGLTIEVADVLVVHGYPRPDGTDWIDLQQALFRFLYGPRS